jgi:7,8-dihydropterin-6-yl-methyl-4-(beta-D-ribofuranosyl)aminobenzene 5'-phosphate synthase
MKARITLLVENRAEGPGLLGEHGLAYWIEYDGRHVLFDTGQGSVLVGNAYKLSIPLRELDALVLSHGHYDHTGGVADVLKTNRPVTVYAHPAALAPKYARNGNGSAREIGMPYPAEKAIRQPQNRLVAIQQPTAIFEGLMATGPVPRQTDFEDTGGPFFLDRGCRTPDPLEDDQSLFLETAQGTLVLLGCAHSGVINTLRHIRQLTRNRPIWTVIGGMHLVQASPQRIQRTVEELQQLGVQRLAPAHCTGAAATAAIWNAFPEKCLPCHVGTQLEFEIT